jgi:hypothetical protein
MLLLYTAARNAALPGRIALMTSPHVALMSRDSRVA